MSVEGVQPGVLTRRRKHSCRSYAGSSRAGHHCLSRLITGVQIRKHCPPASTTFGLENVSLHMMRLPRVCACMLEVACRPRPNCPVNRSGPYREQPNGEGSQVCGSGD